MSAPFGRGWVVAGLLLLGLGALRAAVRTVRRRAPSGRARRLQPAGPPRLRAFVLPDAHPRLAAAVADTAVGVDPALFQAGWAGAGALLVAVALAGGLGAAAVAAATAAGAPLLAWRLLRHRGAGRVEAALPAAVEEVARSLRSGASLRQAVAEAAGATPAPLGPDLAAVATAAEHGPGLVPALEGWAARRPLPGVQLVAAALCVCAETGGAAARAVDAVAVTLRQRLAASSEATALATQARVSAAVIAGAPVAFCALSAAADPRSATFLLRTRVGLVLLFAGLALDALGALWMGRITRAVAGR